MKPHLCPFCTPPRDISVVTLSFLGGWLPAVVNKGAVVALQEARLLGSQWTPHGNSPPSGLPGPAASALPQSLLGMQTEHKLGCNPACMLGFKRLLGGCEVLYPSDK